MLVTDIDHLQIAAPKGCEAEARRFFGDLLGLQEIEKPAPLRLRGGGWFRIGSRQLHIGVEEPFRPATKAHPGFSVRDIDSAFELLEQQGVRCVCQFRHPGTSWKCLILQPILHSRFCNPRTNNV
jgi:catechol 2,3-dioxygenase-like lactoylglutathione lyase family enzyme